MADPQDGAQGGQVAKQAGAEQGGAEEKRSTRRFPLRLPLSVNAENPPQGSAETRDVSARGVCFFVDSGIANGSGIDFTLTLPPEITLTESIRVRCRGKVVRVNEPSSDGKVAVAAVIEEYEFLP
ncbi:MAG: PilZ domain-containing protein [Terriglobales bacterium]|jgi:hypothetical protein